MKRQNFILIIIKLLIGLNLITGCTPKAKVRNPHEGKKEVEVQSPAENEPANADAYNQLDLQKYYQALPKTGKLVKPDALIKNILIPLSHYVLNPNYLESPEYRTTKMREMVDLFAQAFLLVVENSNVADTRTMIDLKKRLLDQVFARCSPDLRSDCANLEIFFSPRISQILVLIANEFDDTIENELKTHKTNASCIKNSELCRKSVNQRYRVLAMASRLKTDRLYNDVFTIAYLKYSRLFAEYMLYEKSLSKKDHAIGYIEKIHGQVFETLIAQYQTKKNSNYDEYVNFINNFGPWHHSNRRADIFSYGTRVMFGLAAQCCLYQDSEKKVWNSKVSEAFEDSQKERDESGESFTQMLAYLGASTKLQIFKQLQIDELYRQYTRKDPEVYNELTFLVDRMFRGHLTADEVGLVLKYANPERVKKLLPKVVIGYVTINMLYKIVKTNEYMQTQVYLSPLVGSSTLRSEAKIKSQIVASGWMDFMARLTTMKNFLASYFRARNNNDGSFTGAMKMFMAINENVHLQAVYPNMIGLLYAMSKYNAKVAATESNMGELSATQYIAQIFDQGDYDIWAKFSESQIPLARESILYAIYYALKTGAIDTFTARSVEDLNLSAQTTQEFNQQAGKRRIEFITNLLNQYLDPSIDLFRNKIVESKRSIRSHPKYETLNDVCKYELNPQDPIVPQEITLGTLESVAHQTYTGVGENGLNQLLMQIIAAPGYVLDDGFTRSSATQDSLKNRLMFAKAIMSVLISDLEKSGVLANANETTPELSQLQHKIFGAEQMVNGLFNDFMQVREQYMKCYLHLQEVERLRQFRLYGAEREFLSRVFDTLVDLKSKGASAEQYVQASKELFAADSLGIFDRIDEGKYVYTRYSLLQRMRRRIEQGDVFRQIPADEIKKYTPEQLTILRRSRPVRIKENIDIAARETWVQDKQQENIYLNASINLEDQKSVEEARELFIAQGLTFMNSKQSSFIDWWGRLSKEDASRRKYIWAFSDFYRLGRRSYYPAGCQEQKCAINLDLKAEDLVKDYVDIFVDQFFNDALDEEYSKYFAVDGRRNRDQLWDNIFIANNTQRSLPLFSRLMSNLYQSANLSQSQTKFSGSVYTSNPVMNSLLFVRKIKNLKPNEGIVSLLFPVDDSIEKAIRNNYGDVANTEMQRVQMAYQEIKNFDHNLKYNQVDQSYLQRRKRLSLPVLFELNTPHYWNSSFYDMEYSTNFNNFMSQYILHTGDFYHTSKWYKRE